MQCLHCGGCCKSMSPKSAPFRCPDLIRTGAYYFCKYHAGKPRICREFDFVDALYCPYGMNELRLSYPEDDATLRDRVETGRRLLDNLSQACARKKETE